MTASLALQVVDQYGFAAWEARDVFGRTRITHVQAHPAAAFLDVQPVEIPVTLQHGGPVLGQVLYMEHGIHGADLTAVAIVDADPEQLEGMYASAEVRGQVRDERIGERLTLTGLACVARTAGLGAHPIGVYPGDFRDERVRTSRLWQSAPVMFERAARAVPRYTLPRDPVVIRRSEEQRASISGVLPLSEQQGMGPVEIRTGGRVLSVR